MPSTLNIRLLGEFRVWTDQGPVDGFNSGRAQAFLAYLLLHRDAPQSRQSLAFLLYPDSIEKQARTNLRQLIHLLRQALPAVDAFVLADGQNLQWRADSPFTLDVLDFEAAAQAGTVARLRAAAELYRGELLPGCYDDWVLAEREQLRQRYVDGLEQLIELLTDQRDYRSAVHYAELLLPQDSLREETYRQLMRLHAWRGDPAGMVRVYQMCAAVLERELGVAVSLETRETYQSLRKLKVAAPTPADVAPPIRFHNLPLQLTRFLGREREVGELQQLLQPSPNSAAVRLVTLTGVGGCGKTRLALQVAAGLSRDDMPGPYPDGVWLVELAPLSEAGQVSLAVAKVLNVQEQPGGTLLSALSDQLHGKALLLILDNCEHLLDACAQLAEALLQHCPQLQILATSRERLNIPGEQVWPVPTLSLAAVEDEHQLAEIQRSDAVQLFVERAAATLPSFHLNTANAGAVARICRQLDGIPLAIELAAARVKVLPLQQMAERLADQDRFRLLTGGSRNALPRQQTLRGLVDWSYNLLSEPERVLFRRLAVFAGGWTLEAAEAVCSWELVSLGSLDTLDALARLVDKSLVTQESSDQVPRYRYLETIRQYAAEKLRESGESKPVQQRHLAFFRDFVVTLEPVALGPDQFAALDQLDHEHDNVRAALDWAAHSGNAADGLRMCGALFAYWGVRSRWTEGHEYLDMILSLPSAQVPTAERARALGVSGALHGVMGNWSLAVAQYTPGVALALELGPDARHELCEMLVFWAYLWTAYQSHDTAETLAQEGLELARALHDDYLAGIALNDLGLVALARGDLELAGRDFKASVALGRAVGNQWSASGALGNLGGVLTELGDYAQAQSLIVEAAAIHRRIGDKFNLVGELGRLGHIASRQGNDVAARDWWSEGLALARELGMKVHAAYQLCPLALLDLKQGDDAAALARLRECLALARELTNDELAVNSLAGLAVVAAVQQAVRRAVRLRAAAEALRANLHIDWIHVLAPLLDNPLLAARVGLDETEFQALWDAGSALTLEQATAYALAPE